MIAHHSNPPSAVLDPDPFSYPPPLRFFSSPVAGCGNVFQAEGLLTYVIHPPDNKVQSLDENGEMMTTFELNKKVFLDVRIQCNSIQNGCFDSGWVRSVCTVPHVQGCTQGC